MSCKDELHALEAKNKAEAREFTVTPFAMAYKEPSLHLYNVQARVQLLHFTWLRLIVSTLTGEGSVEFRYVYPLLGATCLTSGFSQRVHNR